MRTISVRIPWEECAKRFQAGTIHISQKAAQAGAMRQIFASKQGHESWSKGR
jgi:hypothetical protein